MNVVPWWAIVAASSGTTPWWPPAVAAVISLAGVVFVAVYNARSTRKSEARQEQLSLKTEQLQMESQQKLEEMRSTLTRARDEESADREYRFEALKRLYTELDPLLFQLREQSEAALFRIFGLARTARIGRLIPEAPSKKKNRLHDGSASYLPSTLYRFMAPLATFRLCQQRLTAVDLSLEHGVRQQQYLLAKLLYRSWSDGDEIAEIVAAGEKGLPYHPNGGKGNRAGSAQQHLSVQKIERIIESAMLVREADGSFRCATLGEFFGSYEDAWATQFSDAVGPLKELFVSFNPGSRPVLWRLLLVHAYLYAALSGRAAPTASLDAMLDADTRQRLSWTNGSAPDDDALLAARGYLESQIAWRALTTLQAPAAVS